MKNMKIKLQFLSLFVLISMAMNAQYQVGEKTVIYTDPNRDNREIECVIYYPATVGGVDAAIASGTFPAIIFGHGTAMADPTLYQYLWDALPAAGYICLVPTTEDASPPLGAPDHESFGLDLRFINLQIKAENDNVASFFFNHVTERTAIMGHSLGGKGTLIAAANNNDLTTIVTLCAALGDPPWPYDGNGYDVINNSLPFITVPSLVVDTEFDCVVPVDEGQFVTYELLNVDCKTYVKILGGGHCYMASSDASSCETAEGWMGGNCEGDFTISRADQNQTVLDIILPYFEFMLKDVAIAEDEFLTYITSSPEVTYIRDCEIPDPQIDEIDIYNNVANINVPYGTPQNTAISQLVQTTTISDTDAGTHVVNLNWSVAGYNANVPSGYLATGTFTLPAGVIQTTPPTTLSVTATITVDEFVSTPQFTSNEGLSVFPNPAKEILFYKLNSSNDDSMLSIYNVCGQLIIEIIPEFEGTIDIKDLKPGIYIVKFQNQTQRISVE